MKARKIKLLSLVLAAILLLGSCTVTPTPDTPSECVHVDVYDDGYCDKCAEYLFIIIDLYALNDLHGKLLDGESHPGADEITTYIKNMRAIDDHAILLSTGDMWQGSSESNLTYGLMMTDWMNELDFVSMTLGNHEYDWGEEYIEANRDAAEFPFLAINVYDRETNERVDYCDASVTVECGDITVGIIGAMGDCYSSISAEQSAGVYFKTGAELTSLVKAESTRLREEGADVIIYSIHDGHGRSSSTVGDISSSELRGYYDVSLSNGYVDAVFEGHTHQNYIYRDDWGVYHLQGGGDNKGLTHLELAINSVTGTVITTDTDFIRSTALGSLDGDPVIGDLAEKYKDDISKADDILGTNFTYRSSGYLTDLVALLYYEKGVELWGGDYDIALGGAYLKLRSPYELERGDVTYGDVYSILPFDNQIVLCSIEGKYLKSRFLYTSNDGYHIYKNPSLASQIDDNATYYIVTDTYTSTYAPNNLTELARLDASTYARDLLADYIKDGGLE